MSKESGCSSGSVGIEGRKKIGGLCNQCWCGEMVVLKISKSDKNPNRRYFRCAFAAFNQLQGDKQLFQWVDDAMLSEIELLNTKIERLDEIVKELTIEKKEMEMLFARFEEIMLQKVEDVLEESKRKLKLSMLASFGGLFLIVLMSAMTFSK